jgi:tryptophan-rich sensory protein
LGIVWTGLYAGTGWAGGEVLPQTPAGQRRSFARAFAAKLVLNAAWAPVFFRAYRSWAAAIARRN